MAWVYCEKHGIIAAQCSKCFEEKENKCGGVHVSVHFPPHETTRKVFEEQLLMLWAETCTP